MKFLEVSKDGGAESSVWAYWLFEVKSIASVALLRFEGKSRDAYHSHAFDCVSWVVAGGGLIEHLDPDSPERRETGKSWRSHKPSWRPVITRRETTHKVHSRGRTWVLTFRGPWADKWREILPGGRNVTLTHGRREVQA